MPTLFHTPIINSNKQVDHLSKISSLFPSTLYFVVNGEATLKTTPNRLLPLLTFLKLHTGREYNLLRDLTAIDHPERKNRLEVVYSLLSIKTQSRLTVIVEVSEGSQTLPSVTSLFESAGWAERETWDRFGVFFSGHSDLRRLLTDYGFRGHPLRKSFPVLGYLEVRYDARTKRIVYEGVSTPQEYRLFTLENTWA